MHSVDPVLLSIGFMVSSSIFPHKHILIRVFRSSVSFSFVFSNYLGLSDLAAMAAVTACASTALAGQSLLRQSNELARNVNLGEARVTMRKSASKSAASGSIWSVLALGVDYTPHRADFVVFWQLKLCRGLVECSILRLLLSIIFGDWESCVWVWIRNLVTIVKNTDY